MRRYVYAIATMDTKGQELAFIADRLAAAGVPVRTVDVGTLADPASPPSVDRRQVARCHPQGADAVLRHTDRGAAVASMATALQRFMADQYAAGQVGGAIGIGGTGGTAILAPALRGLPIGIPKVIVSTVAGAGVADYVGNSDLVLFPSVVDVAGLNSVSRRILANAAGALAGMMLQPPADQGESRPAIGMTMFGVTTPCVDAVRGALHAQGFDCLVFHATGAGGRCMEQLVAAGLIQGVLDITTTEVADEVVGGIFPAGSARFDAILAAGIPYVVSLGALDMVNFGALETVPERFRPRRLHVHNPNITLMRTTAEENRLFARWIAAKLNRSTHPVEVLIPQRGVSALDADGGPFDDPDADAALFDELEAVVDTTDRRVVRRLDLHINDAAFATALSDAFLRQWTARRCTAG